MTRTADVDGVTVHYLGTPVRYRWMGVTPTIQPPAVGARAAGRDPRVRVPGLRRDVRGRLGAPAGGSVRLRGARDGPADAAQGGAQARASTGSVYRPVLDGARLLVAASSRERDDYLDAGVDPDAHRPQADRVPGTGRLRSPGPAPSAGGSGSTAPYRSCSRSAGSRPGRGSTCSCGRCPSSRRRTSRSSARTTAGPPGS